MFLYFYKKLYKKYDFHFYFNIFRTTYTSLSSRFNIWDTAELPHCVDYDDKPEELEVSESFWGVMSFWTSNVLPLLKI